MTDPMQLPPGFDDLTIDDKVEYLSALWERIIATDSPTSPEGHRDLVRAELIEDAANPDEVDSWATVRADIERELRHRKR